MSDADRLEAIEFKLAHLEHALGELNEVVIRQQRELDEARARQQRLLQQLEVLEARHGTASADGFETPPHY
jgi:uncharacterized coiled-coil protein SlyX